MSSGRNRREPVIAEEVRRSVQTAGGAIAARFVGADGPTLLLLHGLLVNGHVWDPVIPALSQHCRLVLPDLPLGGHTLPLDPDADCSPAAHADRVIALARELPRPLVLVGSDTGGAIAQLAVTREPQLFDRLVLLPSDAFTNCPPLLLAPLGWLAHVPGTINLLARALRAEWMMRQMLLLVSRRRHERRVMDGLVGHLRSDPGVRRDLAKVLRKLRPAVTSAVARELHRFTRPVLVIWTEHDPLFPRKHAERLAACFPDSTVRIAHGSRAFVSLDAPEFLAAQLLEFVGAEPDPAR